MIKKKFKLTTEDFKLPFKNVHNGLYFSIKVYIVPPSLSSGVLDTVTVSQDLERRITHNRYGVVISKKVAKLATERNKYKRLIYQVLSEIIQPLNSDNPKLFLIQLKKPLENVSKENIKSELIVINK